MLHTTSPLVAAFEELGKDELDPDHVSALIQQALLFLGNASAHFSQIHCTKILKQVNPEVQSLAKYTDFSQSAPYLFGQGIEQKIKECVDALLILNKTTTTELKPKNFFQGGSSQISVTRRNRYQAQARYQPNNQNQRGFGQRRTF